jgi:kumamolisin
MARFTNYVLLGDSERTTPPGARLLGPIDPAQRLEVSVLVRPRAAPDTAELAQAPFGARKHLTREEYAGVHGAQPDDIALIEEFAHEHGLTVVEASPERRTVVLAGAASALMQAFKTQLGHFISHEGHAYRGRSGSVSVPQELQGVVEGVFGLDDRVQAKPHFRRRQGFEAHTGSGTFTPVDVAKAYDFPGLDGAGECIGIIELGGGYRTSDLRTYFAGLGRQLPVVRAVSVDGGHNAPTGNPDGPDGEVMLDIEVAGAIAPGARIAVYFAPNTDRGFLDALTTAIHDSRRKPSVISISWGGPESAWTAQAMRAFDQAMAAAALLGVTVCCASGDDGSSDGVRDSRPHVDFPASSPHALACGGTRLAVSGTAAITESAWNDTAVGGGATGGGVSNVFRLPPWQAAANVPTLRGRGVPDVAGDADPQTGYRVRVDGLDTVIGGTSAVAPLWAALLALLNQQLKKDGLGPVGFIQPFLYRAPVHSTGFRDVIGGDNGAYEAVPGWDACTGWGSPKGNALLGLLRGTHA